MLLWVPQSLDPTDTIPDDFIETSLAPEVLKQTCPSSLLNVKDEEVCFTYSHVEKKTEEDILFNLIIASNK